MRYIKKNIDPPLDFEQWKEGKKVEIEEKCTAYEISKTKENKKEYLSADIVWNLLPSSPAKQGNDFSKVKLRELLLEEQGYLCAYCGSQIVNNNHVRGDHVTPKSLAIRRTFDYYNIVAACSGGDNPFLIEKRHNIYLRFNTIFKIISAPSIPKEQKKAILIKESNKTTGNKLEEMVFVKDFFWKTLSLNS